MSTRVPMRDSVIHESHLVPHLRRQRGGKTYATVTTGGGASGSSVIAHYERTTSATIACEPWASASYVPGLGTIVQSHPDVTINAPWTFVATQSYNVRVSVRASITVPAGAAGIVTAVQLDGRDAQVSLCRRPSNIDAEMIVRVPVGATMQIVFRAIAIGPESVDVTINSVAVLLVAIE